MIYIKDTLNLDGGKDIFDNSNIVVCPLPSSLIRGVFC